MPDLLSCCFDPDFEMEFELELPSTAEIGLARCARCGRFWILYLRVDVESASTLPQRHACGDDETVVAVMVQLTTPEARAMILLHDNLPPTEALERIGRTRLEPRPHLFFRTAQCQAQATVCDLRALASELEYSQVFEPDDPEQSFELGSVWLG